MQRPDEMPDMITIHSMGARREIERSKRKDERRGDVGGRVRERRGSESEEGGKKDGVRKRELGSCLSL